MTSLVLENREKYIAALQAIFQYVFFSSEFLKRQRATPQILVQFKCVVLHVWLTLHAFYKSCAWHTAPEVCTIFILCNYCLSIAQYIIHGCVFPGMSCVANSRACMSLLLVLHHWAHWFVRSAVRNLTQFVHGSNESVSPPGFAY